MTTFRVTIPPTAEPVSVTEAEAHSRIDTTDTYSANRIAAARGWLEDLVWRALVLRTIEERYDGFPAVIRPQRSPLRAVASIQYLDGANALQTLASSEYIVDAYSEPGRIQPACGEVWPSTYSEINAVRVTYRAGHVVPFTAVAATDVVTAVGHWYADGDPVPIWNTGGAVPAGLSAGTYYARDVSGDTLKLAATSGGAAVDIEGTGTGTHFLGELPPNLRWALLLVFGELYERREQAIVGASSEPAVLAAENLALPWKVHY